VISSDLRFVTVERDIGAHDGSAILRHDPGLAATPLVRYKLEVEGVGFLLFGRAWWSDYCCGRRTVT